MRIIFIVRHGVPNFPNGKSIIQGSTTELELNPLCLPDAANLKSYFADKQIDNWYASPMVRAKQTLLQFIPSAEQLQVLEGAREVCFGRWEGKSWADNKLADPDLFAKRLLDNTVLPPDGEPMRKAAERFETAVLSTKGNCVITAHWTVISLLFCRLSGFPFENYLEVPHPYFGITKLIEDNGKLSVEFVGQRLTPCPNCEILEKELAAQHNDGRI